VNHEILSKLIDSWSNDASFRAAMRSDPLAAIERAGFALGADERAAVTAIDWSLPDEELAARASQWV
jgi:putative modified peptide